MCNYQVLGMQMWQLMLPVTLELPSQYSSESPDAFNVTGTKDLMSSRCWELHGL